MHDSSSDDVVLIEDTGFNLPVHIPDLIGLPSIEFDTAVRPLKEYLKQFDEDGQLSKLMLVDNVTHHKAGDTYVRELLLPEGSLVLSRVHKRPLVNILSKGHAIVIDTNGYNEYTAPCTWVSPEGTQRLVYCPTETVWNTAHVTTANTADDLVEDLTSEDYQQYLSSSRQLTKQEMP